MERKMESNMLFWSLYSTAAIGIQSFIDSLLTPKGFSQNEGLLGGAKTST